MSREYTSVHDAHCCKIHGCKYGDDNCPVFTGDEEGVKCEDCFWEENDPATIELKSVKQQRDELLAALKEMREICCEAIPEFNFPRINDLIAKAEGLTP